MNRNRKEVFLVTGGAGFIGSNIVATLLNLGKNVVVFDNLSTGRMKNIQEYFKDPKFRFIRGDLRNRKEIKEIVKKVDYIFHQAALPSVTRSIVDPYSTLETNILGTLNLLTAAVKSRVKKIVYASSSSIYGPGPVPKKENMSPSPNSPYALSKLTGEQLCQIFSRNYDLPTICLRYFNVFGPRQDPFSEYSAVIPKFISAFLSHKKPTIYGSGEQTRDFTYVENVVEANLRALYSKVRNGEVFNIACGCQTSVLELFKILSRIFSRKIEPSFQKERVGDIKHSFADISKAKKILRYSPKIYLQEGLNKTVRWFIENDQKRRNKN